jgi:hypothetical protein
VFCGHLRSSIILTAIGLLSAFAMWIFNRWVEKQV